MFKKFILSLLLMVSVSFNSFADVNTPKANSFQGIAHGYEIAISTHQIFDNLHGLRAVYKQGEKWVYLSEPEFYLHEIETKEGADEVMIRALEIINAAILAQLAPISVEPESGLVRIEWLLTSKLAVADNEVVLR